MVSDLCLVGPSASGAADGMQVYAGMDNKLLVVLLPSPISMLHLAMVPLNILHMSLLPALHMATASSEH